MADSLRRLKIYFKIWWLTSKLSFASVLENRLGVFFFLSGKFIRFIFFLLFLSIIQTQVNRVVGYNFDQMVTFFLMFNLMDLFGQLFFRGIYWFRDQIISGEFDFKLIKPLNPLFQALTHHTDILDLPLFIVTILYLIHQRISLTFLQSFSFLGLLISGMVIITAIHIAVAALGVITTEVDHTIMIYRDLSQMARVPIDIYTDWIRAILTFVIPIAIAYTFPAKSLLGLINYKSVIIASIISVISFIFSLKIWKFTLNKYSSASS